MNEFQPNIQDPSSVPHATATPPSAPISPGQTGADRGSLGQPGTAQSSGYLCDPSISYTLNVMQTGMLLLEHGVVRSNRRIAKYCEKGKLLCCKNPDSDSWKVNRESIVTLIGEIKQTEKQEVIIDEDNAAALPSTLAIAPVSPEQPGAAPGRPSGQTSTDPIIETLRDVVATLKDQLKEKDQQIARLFNQQERSDVLLHNLQSKMDKLLQIEAPRTANVDGVRGVDREVHHADYRPYRPAAASEVSTPPLPSFEVPITDLGAQNTEERV